MMLLLLVLLLSLLVKLSVFFQLYSSFNFNIILKSHESNLMRLAPISFICCLALEIPIFSSLFFSVSIFCILIAMILIYNLMVCCVCAWAHCYPCYFFFASYPDSMHSITQYCLFVCKRLLNRICFCSIVQFLRFILIVSVCAQLTVCIFLYFFTSFFPKSCDSTWIPWCSPLWT